MTKLSASGIAGPFDLVIDNGCYHSLSPEGRAAYVPEVAAVMKPGALLMMWEGIMVADNEIPDRFQDEFAIERIEHKSFPIQRLGLKFAKKKANWYWLRRLGEDEGGLQTDKALNVLQQSDATIRTKTVCSPDQAVQTQESRKRPGRHVRAWVGGRARSRRPAC